MSHHTITITTAIGPAAFRVRVTGDSYTVCGVRVNGRGKVGTAAAALGDLYDAEIRAELARLAVLS